MTLDIKKAKRQLQKLAKTKGMDACHLCGRPYRDYEHTYHGVTKQGKPVAVCAACLEKLEYGIGFGLYTPLDPDMVLMKAAYYSHPWSREIESRKGIH